MYVLFGFFFLYTGAYSGIKNTNTAAKIHGGSNETIAIFKAR